MARRLKAVESLILSEVNVKELQILRDGDDSDVTIVKRIKPDFKSLGPRFGKRMKSLATAVSALDADGIERLESTGSIEVEPADGLGTAEVLLTDVEISTEDIPGWLVASASGVTVALDIVLDESLRSEGIARELINRIQNMRKDTGLEVTDRIVVQLRAENDIQKAIALNMDYIRAETLADEIHWSEVDSKEEVILDDGQTIWMTLKKVNR
jgi:isoleucyl-tRNA synthetase